MAYEKMKIISGNGNTTLSKAIADYFHKDLVDRECKPFPNSEIKVNLSESVRGADVYLIQSTVPPNVDKHYMELWLMARTLKESDGNRVTAILPFCGYTRQDKKKHGREPLSMKLMADLSNTSGIDRYVFIDLHNPAIEGLFAPTPTTNISSKHLFAKALKEYDGIKDYVLVAPDAGAVQRARDIADILHLPTVYIDKERSKDLEVKAKRVVGDVADKNVIIIDDIIDTAGTLVAGVTAVKKEGAKNVVVCATHPVLTDPAIENINKSQIDDLLITDTIPLSEEKMKRIKKKTTVLSWANFLAEKVIRTFYNNESITEALDD